MAITIKSVNREEELRAGGFLWTNEEDPTWLRYRISFETGLMEGFHVSKCQGHVPKVRPFKYSFADQALARRCHQNVATAVFADIGKETVIQEGLEFEENSLSSQVSAWQDFMGMGGGAKKTLDQKLLGERFITYTRDQSWMNVPPGIIRMGAKNAISMARNRRFIVADPVSGFEALNVITAPNMPKGLKIGDYGNPDVDQARAALKSVARPSSEAVSWYGVRDPEVAKYRLQAASSMPILAGLVAESHSLSRAVDTLQPIAPILMERTGLSKAGLKRIGKLTQAAPAGSIFEAGQRIEGEDALGVNRARHTQVSGAVPTDKVLKYLSELPPDRTPQTDQDWLCFNDILSAVAIPLYNATGIPVAKILEPSKGDWVGFHAALAKGADFFATQQEKDASTLPDKELRGVFDRKTMALTTIDFLESIDHFSRTVVLPQLLASTREFEQAEPFVSREFTMAAIDASIAIVTGNTKNLALLAMETSRRYASRIPAMMEIEGRSMVNIIENIQAKFEKYGNDSYPVLTEDFHASNGRVVRPLRDFSQLKRESARLNHCVGGYTSSARGTTSLLFSIQDASGETSFSTFELTGLDGDTAASAISNIRNVQHRANRNGTPSDECKAAHKEYLDSLRRGALQVNVTEIFEWRNYLRENGAIGAQCAIRPTTSWKSVLELDWEDEDIRSQYWQEWGQVLGGKVAKSPNPGVIYSERKTQDLMGAMSPRTAAMMIEAARKAREEKTAAADLEETPSM